jgi:hypothetical protein
MPTSSDRDEPSKPRRQLVKKSIKKNHRSVTQAKLEALTRTRGNNPPTPCVVCLSLTPNICVGDRCQLLTPYFPSPFCFGCQSLHRYCPQCTLEDHFVKNKKKDDNLNLDSDDDSDDWDVSVTDLKDCPVGMSFPDYVVYRLDNGIPRNVTLMEWEEIDIVKERDEMAEYYTRGMKVMVTTWMVRTKIFFKLFMIYIFLLYE